MFQTLNDEIERSQLSGMLGSVLGRQKSHFSDEIEKQSIMWKVNSVNDKLHYKTVTLAPEMHCACFPDFYRCSMQNAVAMCSV